MLVGLFTIPILSIVGVILVYLAVAKISESANDPKIKSDFVKYVIFTIIGFIVLFAWPFIVLGGMGMSFSAFSTDVADPVGAFESVLAICIVTWIIMALFFILGGVFLKRSFDGIASHTKVDMFKTTGLVYLISAVLIFFAIGIFVMIIAFILMIIAFFSLPDAMPTGTGSQQTGRICPACGRPIPMDAQVCPYCGKDFRPK